MVHKAGIPSENQGLEAQAFLEDLVPLAGDFYEHDVIVGYSGYPQMVPPSICLLSFLKLTSATFAAQLWANPRTAKKSHLNVSDKLPLIASKADLQTSRSRVACIQTVLRPIYPCGKPSSASGNATTAKATPPRYSSPASGGSGPWHTCACLGSTLWHAQH